MATHKSNNHTDYKMITNVVTEQLNDIIIILLKDQRTACDTIHFYF